HNNMQGMAAAHLNLALTYLDMENFKEAERNCSYASRLAKDIGNQQLLAETCGTMGEIHYMQGNFTKARNYYMRDLGICQKTKSQREKAIALRRLGELSLAEGKITETSELLDQARSLNRKIGSRLEIALLNLLDGRLHLAEGKREQGRRELEGASLELSLLGRKNIAATVAAEIGDIYLDEGDEPLAREYLLRAISLVSDIEDIPRQVRNLQENLDQKSPLSLDQIRSDSARFKALCRVISLIRTIRDPDRLNKTITETARKITGTERAALILKIDGKDTYRILASTGNVSPGKMLADKNIISILNIAKQLGYPVDISRTNIPGKELSSKFLEAHPSIICIPLRIQDEVAGFLYLDSTKSSAITSDEDHSFLVAFSQQVTLGIERTLLSEKVRQTEKTRLETRPTDARSKERFTSHTIIGDSPAIRHLFELIDSIKEMDTTVLLTGPCGSGKDLTAKTIHNGSHRHDKPFHSLNCSAFPRELIESELFGYEKGAFTGAHRQKIGHFESANGGTIFL
ncbi:MAG: sigma 54-interacting transcriptional regulator, partial [Candidatus Krumholzibacteria bacterium]|nr:sigma 54-interacting transcriptional regulator [Candidatus Krumholzibacteria bacterium]